MKELAVINSNVLEVAIGLVFCYASVALMSSSIFDAIANWLNLRSRTLFKGIYALLNAGDSAGGQQLLLSVYNHALAHPLGNGKAQTMDEIKNKPSYISPTDFAKALIQTVQSTKVVVADGKDTLASLNLGDSQLKTMIEDMLEKAAGNIDKVQDELAKWFDSSMESVTTVYRRHSQLWCFVIALAITIILNIDSVQLFKNLWQQPTLVAELGATDSQDANAAYQQLRTLPIGWQENSLQQLKDTWFVGWLVTASASLFGAPFWFELLKNISKLRPQPKKD
jgi:hypothetical protein